LLHHWSRSPKTHATFGEIRVIFWYRDWEAFDPKHKVKYMTMVVYEIIKKCHVFNEIENKNVYNSKTCVCSVHTT